MSRWGRASPWDGPFQVGQKTIHAVVDDLAKLVPELGDAAFGDMGAGDAYLHEPDRDKVLDHAAAA